MVMAVVTFFYSIWL